jgi:hypothetical protein
MGGYPDQADAFKDVGDVPLHVWITTAPSGFEIFFSRYASGFANPSGPDMARIMEIGAGHGVHFAS